MYIWHFFVCIRASYMSAFTNELLFSQLFPFHSINSSILLPEVIFRYKCSNKQAENRPLVTDTREDLQIIHFRPKAWRYWIWILTTYQITVHIYDSSCLSQYIIRVDLQLRDRNGRKKTWNEINKCCGK